MKRCFLILFFLVFVNFVNAQYLGDFLVGDNVYHKWNTSDSNGASVSRTTSGTMVVYRDNETTETITGVLDVPDFDGTTGTHHLTIDVSTSTTFYAAGHDYFIDILGSVIDSQTVHPSIASFSIENRFMRGTDSALLAASVNVSGGVVESNLVQIGSVVQSATDLKDFADDGYNPGTDKVQGVVLVDTTTTNTNERGTNSALLAASVNVAAGIIESNVKQISDDATAADNLESAADNYSVTRGFTGTAVPAAVADAVGGLPISDAGGLDIDTLLGTLTSLAAATNDANVFDQFNRTIEIIESQRGFHTSQGQSKTFHVDPVNGDTHANGNRGGIIDPYLTLQDCHDNAVVDSRHDVIIMVAGAAAGATTHNVAATTTISKRYVFIRGPGRDFIFTRTGNGNTIEITGDGIEISGMQIGTAASGSGDGINITDADFHRVHDCWFLDTRGDGIHILRGENTQIHDNYFEGTGVAGSGQGIHIVGTAGSSNNNVIHNNHFADTAGDSILIEDGSTNDTEIHHNIFHNSSAWGVNIGASSTDAQVHSNIFGNNTSGNIQDNGTNSILINNDDSPTAIENREEMDSNSTQLAEILDDMATSGSLTTHDATIKALLPAALVSGKMDSSVSDIVVAALDLFFSRDSGNTSAGAVAGSVVKEIVDNAGGSSLTTETIATATVETLMADTPTIGNVTTFQELLRILYAVARGKFTTTGSITSSEVVHFGDDNTTELSTRTVTATGGTPN